MTTKLKGLQRLKLLNPLYLWREMWRKPTFNEVIANDMAAASKAEEECRQVILSHRYQEHMARATIEAINAWREQEGLAS